MEQFYARWGGVEVSRVSMFRRWFIHDDVAKMNGVPKKAWGPWKSMSYPWFRGTINKNHKVWAHFSALFGAKTAIYVNKERNLCIPKRPNILRYKKVRSASRRVVFIVNRSTPATRESCGHSCAWIATIVDSYVVSRKSPHLFNDWRVSNRI